MADRYRISQTPRTKDTDHQSILRPVLWLVLFVSTAANAMMSSIGANPLAGAGFGLITLACAITLVVHHYRNRSGTAK
jgi:hypothetical protein